MCGSLHSTRSTITVHTHPPSPLHTAIIPLVWDGFQPALACIYSHLGAFPHGGKFVPSGKFVPKRQISVPQVAVKIYHPRIYLQILKAALWVFSRQMGLSRIRLLSPESCRFEAFFFKSEKFLPW